MSRVVYASNVSSKRDADSLNDDVRLDIVIIFLLKWHKLSFPIEQFDVEV